MRIIDADTVKLIYRGGFHDDYVIDYNSFFNAPTLEVFDAETVRGLEEEAYEEGYVHGLQDCQGCEYRKRKRGHWVLDPNGMDWNIPAWVCSECHCRNNNIGVSAEGFTQNPLAWAGSNFCPNCGSDNRSKDYEIN